MVNELQRAAFAQAQKLATEHHHLELLIEPLDNDGVVVSSHVPLTVSQAKRVRRESTLLVQALAELRDNLQPGGTR